MVRVTLFSIAGLFLAGLLLSGCGKDKIVEVTAKSPIQVTVTATPKQLDTGEVVTVKANVTAPAGTELTYTWYASAGSFANENADSTSWTAPDAPGAYPLSVVVTDQKNVAIGMDMVAVATYLPPESPFYLGADACATCHNGGPGGTQYATWSQTGHAHALESLAAIGQDRNPACVGCHTVGTKGLGTDPPKDNGGYDETAVPRLAGVQCENCHGPGSEHPSPTFGSVQVTMDASLCGGCHNGHHPTYEEWQTSLHAVPVGHAQTNTSCVKCHNGIEAMKYLDDPANYVDPAQVPTEVVPQTCPVCHDPHGNDNPGLLRNASVTDVVLPGAILVEKAGAGRLCMSCHNGRRSSEDAATQVQDGNAHFGPHHAVQGDMLAGVNAYEAVAPSFAFKSSKHILVEDACVTCHTHPHDADPVSGLTTFTGHTFEPTVQACQPCHGELTTFDDVLAKEDYDGDGMVEGVQDEVVGLLSKLEETIVAAAPTAALGDSLAVDFEGRIGNTDFTTAEQRAAGYNWAYVDFDGSKGVHNRTYAVQLLQQSILALDPNGLSAAYILVDEN